MIWGTDFLIGRYPKDGSGCGALWGRWLRLTMATLKLSGASADLGRNPRDRGSHNPSLRFRDHRTKFSILHQQNRQPLWCCGGLLHSQAWFLDLLWGCGTVRILCCTVVLWCWGAVGVAGFGCFPALWCCGIKCDARLTSRDNLGT